MRRLLAVAVLVLGTSTSASAAASDETRVLEALLTERAPLLHERLAALETDWPGSASERKDWELRLRGLRQEQRLLARVAARLDARRPRRQRSDLSLQIDNQMARLEGAAKLGIPPGEVSSADCSVANAHAPDGVGSISGTVRLQGTNAPVANATLTFYDCNGGYVGTDVTDGTGAYSTSWLAAGRYYLEVSDNNDGLVNEIYPDVTCFACFAAAVGTPVDITTGPVTGIDFSLVAGARLAGSVRDSFGAGIPGAVFVGTPDGRLDALATTAAAGSYSTRAGLPPGRYTLLAYAVGVNFINQCYGNLLCPSLGWSGDAGLPTVQVTAGVPVSGLDFTLTAGGRVAGLVTDTGSNPVSGASISVGPDSGEIYCSTTTDVNGAYECRGLVGGVYTLRVAKAGYVTQLFLGVPCLGCTPRGGNVFSVSPGGLTSMPTVALAAEATISGTVREGSGPGAPPLAAATVSAHGPKGVALAVTLTDAAGNYTLGQLPAGSYFLRASAPGFTQSLFGFGPCPGCAVTAYGQVVPLLAGGGATGRDLALSREAGLRGTVTGAGQPIRSVTVSAYDVTGRLMGQDATDCFGQYAISGLEGGDYYVQTRNTLGYIDEAAGDVPCWGCAPPSGSKQTVVNGTSATLDFALAAGGRLTGVVTDQATGRGLDGQFIYIYTATGSVGFGITDELGRYTTGALPPGTYYVAVETSNGYRRHVAGVGSCDFNCSPAAGTPIAVGATPVSLNLALQAGGRIVGTILTTWGSAPSGYGAVISDATSVLSVPSTRHSSGRFASSIGLPAGNYTLYSTGTSGYLPRAWGGTDCFPAGTCGASAAPIAVTTGASTIISPLYLTQAGRLAGRVDTALGPASSVGLELFSSTGASVATTTAETSGLYRFSPGLPVGTYYMRTRTSATGYLDQLYASLPCTGVACSVTSGTPLSLGNIGGNSVNWMLSTARPKKGDFNLDANTDLVLRNLTSNVHNYWLMSGPTRIAEGAFSPSTPLLATQSVVGVDDFDKDGRNDLVFWDSASGAVEFWLMNGTSRIGGPVPLSPAGHTPPWRLSATADFDRNGQPDLLWRNFSTQKIEIWRMNGTSRAGTSIPTPDQAVDGNWEIVAALDWNGDGYTDLLWYNPNSGKIVTWFLDGGYRRILGNFTTPSNAGNNNWRVVAGGDYGIGLNGRPGTFDLVWRNATSGKLVVWHLNQRGERTEGLFTTPQEPTPALAWTVAGPK